MAAVRKSHPRFRRDGVAPRIELTDDDVTVLRHVYRHRFIRADDIYRLFPGRSEDKLSRRLMRLYRNGFLDRPIAQVDRFREGGSRALVYGLDSAGARYLKEKLSAPTSSADWKARNRAFTRENLDHTLSVTRFMVDLELACARRDGVAALPLDEILKGAPEKRQRLPQPGRWPVEFQWRSARGEVHIIPDAIFGLRAPGAENRPIRTFVFLEIDRGTMTIAPARHIRESEAFVYRTSVLRKLVAYAESYRQELHKLHFGVPAARVLLLTTSAARAEAMRSAAQEMVINPMKLPPGLFLFGVQDSAADPLAQEFFNAGAVPTRLLRDH